MQFQKTDLHPDALTAFNNLAVVLDALNVEETEEIYRQVLIGRKHVLGETHPDTLSSLHIISGSIIPGQAILAVDDCLATGSTLDAMVRLVGMQGGTIKHLLCVMEMCHPDLGGQAIAASHGITVSSVLRFSGK